MPLCLVTADSDSEHRWIEIEASSVFEAACFYESYCGAPPMGCKPPPRLRADTIFTVRVGDKDYRVRRGRMMAWANEKAEETARRLDQRNRR
jgi:hypothetical protein